MSSDDGRDPGGRPTTPSAPTGDTENVTDLQSTAPLPKASASVGRGRLALIALALVGLWLVAMLTLGLLVAASALLVVWAGLPLLVVGLAMLRRLARAHRRLAAQVLGTDIAEPYMPFRGGSLFVRLRRRLTDSATWRDLGWLFETITIGFALRLAALLAYLVLPLAFYGAPALLRLDAAITRQLIGPSDARLQRRITDLERSRAQSVDHSAAELRRIERDLHDGAQAQLVALGMNLGLAEELLTKDPATAATLIAEARRSSSEALAELRALVRGIHPPVLADRGLMGGIAALALAHPAPVTVSGTLDGRAPDPVESAAYFAVRELLTNSAKHSGAGHVTIDVRHENERLEITVGDDGVGGALVLPGGGLEGLLRRLNAFDGTVQINSPAGGPTTVTVAICCALQRSPGSQAWQADSPSDPQRRPSGDPLQSSSQASAPGQATDWSTGSPRESPYPSDGLLA